MDERLHRDGLVMGLLHPDGTPWGEDPGVFDAEATERTVHARSRVWEVPAARRARLSARRSLPGHAGDFGGHRGYARLAIELGVPIVPVALLRWRIGLPLPVASASGAPPRDDVVAALDALVQARIQSMLDELAAERAVWSERLADWAARRGSRR